LITDGNAAENSFYLVDVSNGNFIWNEHELRDNETYSLSTCLEPNVCAHLVVIDNGDHELIGDEPSLMVTYDGSEIFNSGDIGFSQVFTFGCS
jgi:hypothetical protein